MPVLTINTAADSRLEPYRHLKQSNLTRGSGEFIAEGKLVVERLLASRFETRSLLLSERRLGLLEELRPDPSIEVLVVSDELARELTGFEFHSGVLGCGRRGVTLTVDALNFRESRATWPMLPASDPDAGSSRYEGTLLVACPRMTDPDNLGGLIRLCRAFGVAALCLGEGCCDPFSRRTLRVSMGNAFELPIIKSSDLAGDLARLQSEHGCTLTGTVLEPSAIPLHLAPKLMRDVLLLGNEAQGLEPAWVAHCDRLVTIPMHGGTDSLNVTVAAGICLHWLQQAAVARESPTSPPCNGTD